MNNLQQEVLIQLGYDELDEEALQTLSDVAQYGAAGGFGDFVYYTDTAKFYDDNEVAIDQLLLATACEFDQTVAEFVASFGCLDLEVVEVEKFFMGYEDEEDTYIKNALAWFALEDTAYKLTEQ